LICVIHEIHDNGVTANFPALFEAGGRLD
jgi:hypothetical protein